MKAMSFPQVRQYLQRHYTQRNLYIICGATLCCFIVVPLLFSRPEGAPSDGKQSSGKKGAAARFPRLAAQALPAGGPPGWAHRAARAVRTMCATRISRRHIGWRSTPAAR